MRRVLWWMILGGILGGHEARAWHLFPVFGGGGQGLELNCDEEDRMCRNLCEGVERCVLREGVCPGCAGTGNLALKELLDAVGVRLRAGGAERPAEELWRFLRSGRWISLHSRTLYNFSSPWNGGALRAAFFRACREVEAGAEGILLLEILEPGNPRGVQGPRLRPWGFLCGDGEGAWVWAPEWVEVSGQKPL